MTRYGRRVLVAAWLSLLAGCGVATPGASVVPTGSQDGAPPTPEATATPTEVAMRSPQDGTGLVLRSPEIDDGGTIPRRYACDGEGISPPLEWEAVPPETRSLALVVDDPDARGYVHWVVFDMTVSATGSIPANWSKSPDASPQGTNSSGRVGYAPPCPPSGSHRYVFRLLALGTVLELQGAPTASDVLGAAEGHVLAEATLTASYGQGG